VSDETLIEDPDGAPYPEPVQKFFREWSRLFDDPALTEFRLELVDALESVAKFSAE
jgi:hypothetical protein